MWRNQDPLKNTPDLHGDRPLPGRPGLTWRGRKTSTAKVAPVDQKINPEEGRVKTGEKQAEHTGSGGQGPEPFSSPVQQPVFRV